MCSGESCEVCSSPTRLGGSIAVVEQTGFVSLIFPLETELGRTEGENSFSYYHDDISNLSLLSRTQSQENLFRDLAL